MKIILNKCHGGFTLSPKAVENYCKRIGIEKVYWYNYDGYHITQPNLTSLPFNKFLGKKISKEFLNKSFKENLIRVGERQRKDINLILTIEELGTIESSGDLSSLEIVNIPDDIDFEIEDHDGYETIHEVHRKW